MISLAVFDMAGTTIDDGGAVYDALRLAVEETGVSVAAEDLQTWMGTEKRAAIRALIGLGGRDPESPAGLVDAQFERFREILREQYIAVPPTPIDGVPEAIAALRSQGIKVALTTGFSHDVARGILETLGWEVLNPAVATPEGEPVLQIDALVCGDEVSAGRPAPYMIHRAMERTETASVDEVLVAGDTIVDVQAGAAAGAAVTLGVLSGKLPRGAFDGSPATAIIDSVADIPALVGTWQ